MTFVTMLGSPAFDSLIRKRTLHPEVGKNLDNLPIIDKLNMSKLKCIALNLPQYHPIPENDEWWGKGFTDWTNVASASPLFKDHYQPHQPAELGYYDLRSEEIRSQQATMAKKYGISGFCYYHYWFNGKELLESPVNEILNSGKPDFPYCLCWANKNWTRRWNGLDQDILIAQDYSLADDEAHFYTLLPFFQDTRYITVQGLPMFLIYRSSLFPNPLKTTNLWRRLAKEHGIEDLYIVKMESFPTDRKRDPQLDGFDAALDFQPDWSSLPRPLRPNIFRRLLRKLKLSSDHPFFRNNVYAYDDMVKSMLRRPSTDYPRIPSVTPAWDNTARRRHGGATIFHESTPESYARWLATVIEDQVVMSKLPEPMVFINAWNEWAEGNHLEPDLKWGKEYLEETFRVVSAFR